MGLGSPLCVKLHERIVSQFKDNVSQRGITKNLGLSPSTVQNIVKRSRESGELLLRKKVKLLLNAREHRALRQYCYHDGHSYMGSGVLREKIIVTQHSPLLHQEMQLQIALCKEEGIK